MFYPKRGVLVVAQTATLAVAFCTVSFLTGCALKEGIAPSSGPLAGAAVAGIAMGGQQPVTGAVVNVLAVGTTGYGSPGTVLASTTTDSHGSYSFPAGSYTCPSTSAEILLIARGGNPGLVTGTNNTAIYLLAFAGPCGDLTPTTHIQINEITTVAAAYVLRPFQTGVNVGTSSTNYLGIATAYTTYTNLVSNAAGRAPGSVPANVSFPYLRINALANSIAPCVNSTAPSSAPCQGLFSTAGTTTSGGTANVFVALNGILSNPPSNPSGVFNLATPASPFQPSLTSPPPDWSMPVLMTGGFLNQPTVALDVDANNNIWVATKGGFAGTLEHVDATGKVFKSGLLNGQADNIIDLAGDPGGGVSVISNSPGDSSLIHVTDAGQVDGNAPISTSPAGGRYFDWHSITVLSNDTVGIASMVLTSYVNTSATAQQSFSGVFENHIATAPSLGSLYLSNDVETGVARYNLSSSVVDGFSPGYKACQFTFDQNYSYCIAPTTGGSVKVVNTLNAAATQKSVMSIPKASGNGEVDGQGMLWLPTLSAANSGPSALRFLIPDSNGSLQSSYGAIEDAFAQFNCLRIDLAGNVWLTSPGGGLYEIVGAAAPAFVPFGRNTTNNTFGTRP